jgi:DNA-binding transcriptional ArsR family regulator
VEELPLSQSTVSQHLKELKSAGLIQGEIDGARICYCINPEEWEKAKSYFLDLLNLDFQSAKKCC